jgi:hypothetical protein
MVAAYCMDVIDGIAADNHIVASVCEDAIRREVVDDIALDQNVTDLREIRDSRAGLDDLIVVNVDVIGGSDAHGHAV